MACSAAIERVLGALERFGADCSMEEVFGLCPDLTWNEVFLAIDDLSRSGQIQILAYPGRTYWVRVAPSCRPVS